MRTLPPGSRLLVGLITLFALADGVLHLALDFILFRGNLFGPLGPPPGAPPPGPGGGPPPSPLPIPLPLNQLFVLNLVGYVILVLAVWLVAGRLGSLAWLVDLLLGAYVAVVFIGWLRFGGPNPMGLGYLSKGIELLLVLSLLGHIWSLVSRPRLSPRTAAG